MLKYCYKKVVTKMAEYCIYCIAKINKKMKFCHNCEESRMMINNRRPPAPTNDITNRKPSSSI